jgi:hypothetical protein
LTGPTAVHVGGGTAAPALDGSGLRLHVQYQHGNGRFDAELTLHLQAPSVHFRVDITDGSVRAVLVSLQGAGGVSLAFTAANEDQSGNESNHVIWVPGQLDIPLLGGLSLTVSQQLTTTVQLAGRAMLQTHGSYGISGRLDFGIENGSPSLGVATAVSSDSLAHHVVSLGIAAGAVRLRWSVRAGIGVGLGVLSASAYYALGFNAAIEGNGLANDHPGCVQGRVYLTGQFGIGYHVLPVIMDVVNAVLSLFGVSKIPADGGIEGGSQLGPGLHGEYCP